MYAGGGVHAGTVGAPGAKVVLVVDVVVPMFQKEYFFTNKKHPTQTRLYHQFHSNSHLVPHFKYGRC